MVKKIVGPDGQSLDPGSLREPQTASAGQLHHEFQGHPARGLTPSRTAQIMESAEQGDLIAQFELFEDMEERDGHIASEMGKRRRAVSGLEWNIIPPQSPSAAERRAADQLKELLEGIESLEDIEDILFDTTDGVGKGFAALEYEWHRVEGIWVPKSVTHRPQSWFRLHRGHRQELRLRDDSADGAPLQPFGWLVHTHKSKSGYLERASLFRALIWPYLFKNFSVADLAEWLEIYGIPMRIGTFPSGSGDKEKLSLLHALVNIGHNAAGVIPQGMEIEFHDAATGDAKAFEVMLDWCERTVSKVILGATLTSQADRGSNTNALGKIHDDVRKDLRDSDAKQIQRTITRELLYPIAALNGWCDSLRRVPRFVLDTAEREDMTGFADALPKLVAIGMRVPRAWAQEQLGVPEPEGEEDVLAAPSAASLTSATQTTKEPAPNESQESDSPNAKLATATAALETTTFIPPDYLELMVEELAKNSAAAEADWDDRIAAIVAEATSYEDLLLRLGALYGDLPLDGLAAAVESALAVVDTAGRYDAIAGYTDA